MQASGDPFASQDIAAKPPYAATNAADKSNAFINRFTDLFLRCAASADCAFMP